LKRRQKGLLLLSVAANFVFVSVSCSTKQTQSEGSKRTERLERTIVAKVGEIAIDSAEVQRKSQAEAIPKEEALRRLEKQALFELLAAELGYHKGSKVTHPAEQSMVQVLLRKLVEDTHGPNLIKPEAVAQEYQLQIAKFVSPERRASWHVLIQLPKDAPPQLETSARALAEQALADFVKHHDDPLRVVQHYANQRGHIADFRVRGEQVPPLSQSDEADKRYLAALYAADKLGPLPSVVRTSFGWHAIFLSEIQAKRNISLADAREGLTWELVLREREKALKEVLANLRRSYTATFNPTALSKVLSREFATDAL